VRATGCFERDLSLAEGADLGCRSCCRDFCWFAGFIDGFDKQENDESDDQEVDDGHDEIAICKDHSACFPGGSQSGARRNSYSCLVQLDEEVGKINLAQEHANDGHDQVFNQRLDNSAEGAADDNPNSQIERVAFGDKFLKLSDKFFHYYLTFLFNCN